ncbi:hypothetical protein [Curtobacterium aetherium]|uniref:Uncharacterized protein n=1 Tax=Curtobacterium aetherium TaxID=2841594 RepID=A0ACD1E455_9MICO|nr:hypothetical protein [Curtobacterium sp. L6-1]QWS33685.1 hypothetical protein KM842_00195 [Curtobacterium sp. L6-1]
MSKLSKKQLLNKYPDQNWRERFIRLGNLSDLLGDCIIRGDYTVPDELNQAIALSGYGDKVFKSLLQKNGLKQNAKSPQDAIKPNDARLMCFLTFTHTDVLVDIERTDIDAIERSIGSQILAGRIRYPFIFGRELYDRAADLFPTERGRLNIDETDDLLEGTSIGVMQSGDYVTGPYGLLRSSASRDVPVFRTVPLYHCADADCDAVHRTELATDFEAPVNRNREKLRKILEDESREASSWGSFLAEVSGFNRKYFDEGSTDTIAFLIGDALSDSELARLAEALLKDGSSQMQAMIDASGRTITRGRGKFSAGLGRAEWLQLILLCGDEAIVGAVDALVHAERISVPEGEVRRPMVNGSAHSGAFRLQAHLSRFGVGVRPLSLSVASARLRRLLDELYAVGTSADATELDWQLRGVDAPEREGRLEEFFRNAHPRDVLTRLVLSRRSDLLTAGHKLGMRIRSIGEQSDDELLDTLMWKLGFDVNPSEARHARFWRLHESLKRLTDEASISTMSDTESIRSVASNYFVALEELLLDSLVFVIWAFNTDHHVSNRRYTYDPDAERSKAIAILNAMSEEATSGAEYVIRFEDDKNELYSLCRGFGILAGGLDKLVSRAGDFERDQEGMPEYAEHTVLQTFPFLHTRPFLDVNESARATILRSLREVSRLLDAGKVSDVRNSYLHFRRSNAELDSMIEALEATSGAVRLLEQNGFYRSVYRRVAMQLDEWGRSAITLRDESGRNAVFARPSKMDWGGLPPLDAPQYVVTSAQIGEPLSGCDSGRATGRSLVICGRDTRAGVCVTTLLCQSRLAPAANERRL